MPRRRSYLLLVAALLLLAGALCVCRAVPAGRHVYSKLQPVQSSAPRPQYDLYQYYAAGHNWRAGFNPYRVLKGVDGALSIPRSSSVSGYIYPPLLLPVLGQLSRLTYDSARAVWLVGTLVAVGATLALGIALAPGRRLVTLALGLLLVAASDPLLFHIRQGQIDALVAALSISGFLLYGRWRSWPTAACFALAIGTKVTPLVVLLCLCAYYRDWRILAKTFFVGAALVALSLLVVEPGLYAEYVRRVLPAASQGNPFFHNQSLLRSWSHVGGLAKYASLALYAVTVLVAAAAGPGRRPRRMGGEALDSRALQVLVLSVVGALLFSPLAWRMAFVWFVVPLALLLAAAPWRGRIWQYVLIAAGTALISLPVWDYPVLDSLEMLGAALTGVALLGSLLAPRLTSR